MGLRFRKSISIFPGVKLNLGTKGASVSVGVKGARATLHTSGRVTGSVGLPGTGVSYVKSKNLKTLFKGKGTAEKAEKTAKKAKTEKTPLTPVVEKKPEAASSRVRKIGGDMSAYSLTNYRTASQMPGMTRKPAVSQLDVSKLVSIHKASDDSIDWTEIASSPLPPDRSFDADMWQYYHGMAEGVLAGDIDTYLQLIYEVNPLDDLLEYGGNFEFGTDDPQKMEVEFTVNTEALTEAEEQLSMAEFNRLLQDYICSVCIRIARDMFALLPVTHTVVHAVLNEETVVSVDFDRAKLSKVKFGYIDPSDTLSMFEHNMKFSTSGGFAPVEQLVK